MYSARSLLRACRDAFKELVQHGMAVIGIHGAITIYDDCTSFAKLMRARIDRHLWNILNVSLKRKFERNVVDFVPAGGVFKEVLYQFKGECSMLNDKKVPLLSCQSE